MTSKIIDRSFPKEKNKVFPEISFKRLDYKINNYEKYVFGR
jgi:hypothetical protein